MARRKPVRRSPSRSSPKSRRSHRKGFSWAKLWSEMGLTPVYRYWKKWPYSTPFSAFLASFAVAALGLMMMDRGSSPPVSTLSKSGGSVGAGRTSGFDEALASNIDTWSSYVQDVYTRGRWNESFWARFGKAPEVQDSAPLTSKRFDCTTFVETVGALARASHYGDFYENLLGIRYDGKGTHYLNRNHFPEVDWIPNNESAGHLVDITHAVAGKAGLMAHVEEKTIDKGRWLAKQMDRSRVERAIASAASGRWSRPVKVEVPYIPLDEVDRVLKFIPSGAVVNLVRENNEAHDLLIAHQGFFVRVNGQPMYRHSTTKGKIQTVPLKTYFGLQQKKSWPLIGININAFTPGEGAGFQPK